MIKKNEETRTGTIESCQICKGRTLQPVIDLGYHPPCDSLLTETQLHEPENFYPLNIVRCADCGLVQLDYIVPPTIVFHKEYPYRTGITQILVNNFKELASLTTQFFEPSQKNLVVDIGSNDGTSLLQFKTKGFRVLGVEPTNIALLALKNGVPTIQDFFSSKIARKIVKTHGHASVVVASNVFAHINNITSFMDGLSQLLSKDGLFISESQYLMDILEKLEYDTIYHEHLRFYSLKPLIGLFRKSGFSLVHAERITVAGGSVRVFAKKGNHPMSKATKQLLKIEEKKGLYKEAVYRDFRKRVAISRLRLVTLLNQLKLRGKHIVGISSPGRSSTILNYCHIDPVLIPYTAEQSNSLKLGLFTPGTHVPIIDEKKLFKEQPDYAVLFSWHIAGTIIKKLRAKGLRSKFIIPLPSPKIL